jgi:carboxyl-terminal processing protease
VNTRSRSFRILFLPVIFASVFAAGYFLRAVVDTQESDLGLVREALAVMHEYSLAPLPGDLLLQRAMIHAAVGRLDDPFSVYLEPVQHELQADDLAGEYAGIGALLTIDGDGRVILTPFEDGPAFRAGILDGDILYSLNKAPIAPFPDLSTLTADLRGPEGSPVTLGIMTPGSAGEPKTYELLRERFEIPSVTAFLSPLDDSVGMIKIVRFAENSPDEVEAGYYRLRSEGISALILDLRDNGGGLLESTVGVARLFLQAGMILTEERSSGTLEQFKVERTGTAAELPLAVLVNGNTASAAEVLAAALSENGRAILVGNKTFGKGTVQAVVELSDGSSLHITTARWLTPRGEALDGIGLVPDHPVQESDASGPDPYLVLAQELLLSESVAP